MTLSLNENNPSSGDFVSLDKLDRGNYNVSTI